MRPVAIGLGVLCAVCGAPTAEAKPRHSRPASVDAAFAATQELAFKAADRMARECQPNFCMDANEYRLGCMEPFKRSRFTACSYNLFGYYFKGSEPIGDFDCTRPTAVSVDRSLRLHARSYGKTSCRDDRENHATYPWPGPATTCNDTIVIVIGPPIPHTASCAPPLRKPPKTLGEPLTSRGGTFGTF